MKSNKTDFSKVLKNFDKIRVSSSRVLLGAVNNEFNCPVCGNRITKGEFYLCSKCGVSKHYIQSVFNYEN